MGFDSKAIYYQISDKSIIKIMIIDTAGQERFRSMNKSLYSKIDSCILFYDITNKDKFKECEEFNKIIKEMCKKDVKLMLLGNKIDLEDEREVTQKEGLKFAESNGYIFYEISCKNNINVFQAFEKLIEITEKDLEIVDSNYNNFELDKKEIKRKKKNCC